MSKFLNIDEQIVKLSEQKGLIIDNVSYAKEVLLTIGYFSLVTTYKTPFKDSSGRYKPGTRIEDIVALYKADENLRDLFLKYILRIEKHLGTLIAYYFCLKFGEDQNKYLNPNTYIYTKENQRDVYYLVKDLKYIVNVSKTNPVIVSERKNGNVPLWIAINGVTLGSLSKFYSFLQTDIKLRIASHFNNTNAANLEKMLLLLTDFRNTCAHSDPLYNHTSYNKYVSINSEQHNNIYALDYVLKCLLKQEDYNKYINGFNGIIHHFSKNCESLSAIELLNIMGFKDYINIK